MADQNTDVSSRVEEITEITETTETVTEKTVVGEKVEGKTAEETKKGDATDEKEDTAQVDEEPLEDKVPEPAIMTLDKIADILLMAFVGIVLRQIIGLMLIPYSWLIAFTIWLAATITYIACRTKQLLPIGKSVVITGCDTGIGHALAIQLEKLGFYVFALCLTEGDGAKSLRDMKSENMHVIIGDVTKEEDLKNTRKEVEKYLPEGEGLWGIVNNAGIAAFGDVEWLPLSTFRKVNEVNLYGMIAATKTFLPLIRKAKGRVVNMASMLGRMPVPMRSPYVLSKFAVEGFSDCLRFEMKSWGVKVIVIEPGNFVAGTKMFTDEGIEKGAKEMWETMDEEVKSDYGETYFKQRVALMKSYITTGNTDVTSVTETLVCALTDESPRVRYQPMSLYYKTRVFCAAHMPEFLYDYLYEGCLKK